MLASSCMAISLRPFQAHLLCGLRNFLPRGGGSGNATFAFLWINWIRAAFDLLYEALCTAQLITVTPQNAVGELLELGNGRHELKLARNAAEWIGNLVENGNRIVLQQPAHLREPDCNFHLVDVGAFEAARHDDRDGLRCLLFARERCQIIRNSGDDGLSAVNG